MEYSLSSKVDNFLLDVNMLELLIQKEDELLEGLLSKED